MEPYRLAREWLGRAIVSHVEFEGNVGSWPRLMMSRPGAQHSLAGVRAQRQSPIPCEWGE